MSARTSISAIESSLMVQLFLQRSALDNCVVEVGSMIFVVFVRGYERRSGLKVELGNAIGCTILFPIVVYANDRAWREQYGARLCGSRQLLKREHFSHSFAPIARAVDVGSVTFVPQSMVAPAMTLSLDCVISDLSYWIVTDRVAS